MKDLAAVEAFALQFQQPARCRALTAEAKKVAAGRESVLKSFTSLTESQVCAGVVLCCVVLCCVVLCGATCVEQLEHSPKPRQPLMSRHCPYSSLPNSYLLPLCTLYQTLFS